MTTITTWGKGEPIDGLSRAHLTVLVTRKHAEVIGWPEESVVEEGQSSGGRDVVVVVRADRKVTGHSVVVRESVGPGLSCGCGREKLLSMAETRRNQVSML